MSGVIGQVIGNDGVCGNPTTSIEEQKMLIEKFMEAL